MSQSHSAEPGTWTDERIEQLKQLWEQGLSASAIGRALGVTKNAVVGKAHRLKLSSRPSPIRKGAKPPVKRATVLARPTMAPPASSYAGLTPTEKPSSKTSAAPLRATAPQVQGTPDSISAPAVAKRIGQPRGDGQRVEASRVEARAPAAPQPGGQSAKRHARDAGTATNGGQGISRAMLLSAGLGLRQAPQPAVRQCLWPIGDPGEPDFTFCGAKPVPGKPYCEEHCARAYVSKSRADSEAA